MLHIKWLVRFQGKYWNYTKEQADYMADYSRLITPQIYRSFFANTLDLRKVSVYLSVKVPVLAICGSGEVKDMKLSLDMLGKNTCCQTMILPRAGHDFPMRNSRQFNTVLNDFLFLRLSHQLKKGTSSTKRETSKKYSINSSNDLLKKWVDYVMIFL